VYLPEGNRLKTISVTLVGSFSQLLITVFAGTIGFIFLKSSLVGQFPQLKIWYQFILYGLILVLIIMGLVYFNVAGTVTLFNRWIKNKHYIYLIEALQNFHNKLLLRLLGLSLLRYMIFIIQYVLVFYLFEVNVSVTTIATVMSVVFLAMAVIPSIALVEVWLRGEISIKLMGLFSLNTLGIGFTSVTVWFINLILPAIAGSLLLLSLRVFKNENR
jgi:MFS family permease